MTNKLGLDIETFNPHLVFLYKTTFKNTCSLPYHTHNFIEFRYFMSESGKFKMNDVIYDVKYGDIILCNALVKHVEILEEEEMTEVIAGFDNIYIKGLPKNFLISNIDYPIISPKKYKIEIDNCITTILAEQKKNEPGYEIIIKSLIMKMIVLLLKEIKGIDGNNTNSAYNNFEPNSKTAIVDSIASYMNENYMKDISLSKLSNNIYLNPVYVSKIFKDEIGESPINYLIKIRLSKAHEMLKQGNMSIKEISKRVGYDDAYYFSKLFKKHYGYPPSQENCH